jgi:hypothetical protein
VLEHTDVPNRGELDGSPGLDPRGHNPWVPCPTEEELSVGSPDRSYLSMALEVRGSRGIGDRPPRVSCPEMGVRHAGECRSHRGLDGNKVSGTAAQLAAPEFRRPFRQRIQPQAAESPGRKGRNSTPSRQARQERKEGRRARRIPLTETERSRLRLPTNSARRRISTRSPPSFTRRRCRNGCPAR